jgi:galactose-1-phosphate uridylyltransferase
MRNQLSFESLESITQSTDISSLDINDLTDFFLEEKGLARFAPDGICQMDPRNGDWVVYNSARARRPHDNRPHDEESDQAQEERACMICQGHTTHVVDVAHLSEGFTFINKNLYPIFYPDAKGDRIPVSSQPASDLVKATPVQGYHFLQWTSSFHDKDWHNMPLCDRVIVLQRLAALEKKMESAPDVYISIIKNYGHLVGGSLTHGHQQISVSSIMPNRIAQDQNFLNLHDETFSTYLRRENPHTLAIKDYGAALLVTPYFMRRPYDMFLILKDASKSHLYELCIGELEAVADGWRDAIRIILDVMPRIGKEVAYNVTTHNGPGAGLYFEFLPYTQEMGGFEHLGLYLCQGNPLQSAQTAREFLDKQGE